jgi:hypothetical protein
MQIPRLLAPALEGPGGTLQGINAFAWKSQSGNAPKRHLQGSIAKNGIGPPVGREGGKAV